MPLREIQQTTSNSSIFGNAKPVDTTQKLLEMEQKMEKKEAPKPVVKPVVRSNPFGNAKPVDTTKKLSEIEEKFEKTRIDTTSTTSVADKPKTQNSNIGMSRKERWAQQKRDDLEDCDSRSNASSNSSSEVAKQPYNEKPKFKPAPAPVASAWGQKLVPCGEKLAENVDQWFPVTGLPKNL